MMSVEDLARQQAEWDKRTRVAQAAAAQAYARLIELAEKHDSGQIRHVAQFLASSYNGEAFPFDLFILRALDVAISDDMIVCIDALRWGKADLYKLVPDGERRIQAVIDAWGLTWPAE
jgi:hypothetical protein